MNNWFVYAYIISTCIATIAMLRELVCRLSSDIKWRHDKGFRSYALTYGDILKGMCFTLIPALNTIVATFYLVELYEFLRKRVFTFLNTPIIPLKKSELAKSN